jgi:hypothetical protein
MQVTLPPPLQLVDRSHYALPNICLLGFAEFVE